MEEKYEVRNQEIETLLRKLAKLLQSFMPKGWGFTLLIFDYSKPEEKDAGSMFYVSSANRTEMVKAMMEFIDKEQEEQPTN